MHIKMTSRQVNKKDALAKLVFGRIKFHLLLESDLVSFQVKVCEYNLL
jgi:hypothetical protein